jgi:hypothetical protein
LFNNIFGTKIGLSSLKIDDMKVAKNSGGIQTLWNLATLFR